jgi:nucleoside diphosphate kinase
MFTDSELLFASLDLPANPVRPGISWPSAANKPSEIVKVDERVLTDEILSIIEELGLKIDYLMLWTWKKPPTENFYEIHSDGHYTNLHARCLAMNWLITGTSRVDWYSYNGGTPLLTEYGSKTFQLTEWVYKDSNPTHLANWTGAKPAILNIRQPHQVIVESNDVPRRSVTMRFLPNISMEEAISRLGKRVLKINEE